MAEKLAELNGGERESRAAELKRKAQESVARAKARAADLGHGPEAAVTEVAPAAVARPSVAAAPAAVAEMVTEIAHSTGNGSNGSAEAIAASPVAIAPAPVVAQANAPARPAAKAAEVIPDAPAGNGINRREFLTYAWGATLGLLTAEGGLATFLFMYPRFKPGEFGGDFPKPLVDFKGPTDPPNDEATGKFWMITTEDGSPKALYMVCVHLGCLYKWVGSNNRFECPCHGSKYTHDGWYIEGPATRSLDTFAIDIVNDVVLVHTGKKINGTPAAESPFRLLVGS